MLEIKQVIELTRIKDWLHLLGIPLLGFFYHIPSFDFFKLILVISISFLFLAYGFSLNQCANFYKKKKTSVFYKSLTIAFIFLIPALLVSMFISLESFYILAINSFIGFIYSFPPPILRRYPIIVTMMNSLGFGLLFTFGYAANNQINETGILLSSFVGFIFLPIQLVHEIEDKAEDARLRFKSTVMIFDKIITKYLVTFLFLLIAVFAFYINTQVKISSLFFLSSAVFGVISAIYFWNSFGKTNPHKARLVLRYIGIVYGLALFSSFMNLI